MARRHRHLHPPRLLARFRPRDQTRAVRPGMERRILLSVPQVALRHLRARVRRRAGADESGRAAVQVRRRHPYSDRRESGRGGLMANVFSSIGGWINDRAPGLMPVYRKHMTEYYAPKNFNFWYYFGSLAIVVLVNQILTGIFLTMFYKPGAAT